jgi:hypothetical protein
MDARKTGKGTWLGGARPWLLFALAAQPLLLAWLFLGVYRDREHGDHYLFIKARPTSQVVFRAPAGEADDEDLRLSSAEWAEEYAYREHVERLRGHERGMLLPW